MSLTLPVIAGLAVASIWGAAYLLSLWHEDRNALQRLHEMEPGKYPAVSGLRTWTFSRVLAYVSIMCTLASNYLTIPTALRLFEIPNFREMQIALTPLTIGAIIMLDVAFVIIALYLRVIRRRRRVFGLGSVASLAIPIDEGEEAHAGEEDALDQATAGVRGAEAEGLLEDEGGEDREQRR